MTQSAVSDRRGIALSFPIQKVDEELREVWGVATTEALDVQGEVVDYDASKVAFGEWADQFSRVSGGQTMGNIREMHQPNPVGKLISWKADDQNRRIMVGVKLSRSPEGESAWLKIKERVLNGFSIGAPSAERRVEYVAGRPVTRVVGYKLSELSLVDNPACPEAWIEAVKLAKSASVTGNLSEPASFSGALDLIGDAEPVKENAYVDPSGGVWKRINGVFKGEQMANVEKAGKHIGPSHRTESGPPGPEIPKVVADPEADVVLPKKAVNEGSDKNVGKPGGPHAIAGEEISAPEMQGKAANAGFPPAAGAPPAPAPAPQAPPQAAPAAPAAAPQGARYNYCAMCAGKLADGSQPAHAECGGGAPPAPAPAAPPAPAGAPAPFPPKTAGAIPVKEQGDAVSVPDGQGKEAAAFSAGLEKAFASGLGAFKAELSAGLSKMNETIKSVADRVERIEKTPIPGGPSRTELPEGVRAVEKGGGSKASPMSDAQEALEKAQALIADPFLRDKLSMEIARFGIMKAQSGR